MRDVKASQGAWYPRKLSESERGSRQSVLLWNSQKTAEVATAEPDKIYLIATSIKRN